MSPARLALILGFVVPALAFAEPGPVPIAIAPFHVRCFDSAALAERVRARMPEATVRVGAPPSDAHQTVRVGEEGDSLVLEVTARDARRRVIGSERRLLPRDGECAALLETSAQIVIRAATPIRAHVERTAPRVSKPRERHLAEPRAPAHPEPTLGPGEPAPSPAEPVPARVEPAPAEAAAPPTPQPPAPALPNPAAAPIAPARPSSASAPPGSAPPPAKVSAAAIKVPPLPHRLQLELDAAAMWAFPLDGPPSNPAGELVVGIRWSRLGVALRAGVEGEGRFSAMSSAGPVAVFTRRVPLAALLDVDLPVRGGAFRLAAGPLLSLWLAGSGGVPHPVSRTLVEPGATLRAAYRLELGRVVLGFGVSLDVGFVSDDLAIGGVGTVGRTPLVELAPYLSLGTRLF